MDSSNPLPSPHPRAEPDSETHKGKLWGGAPRLRSSEHAQQEENHHRMPQDEGQIQGMLAQKWLPKRKINAMPSSLRKRGNSECATLVVAK